MKYATFAKNGALSGFFDDAIHKAIPAGAKVVTDAQWKGHIDGRVELRRVSDRVSERAVAGPSITEQIAATLGIWANHVTRARSMIAGTTDPAKFAEYADKVTQAPAIIDGTAPPEITAEAQAEAERLGLADAAAAATLWLAKGERLRAYRSRVNIVASDFEIAIRRARDTAEITATLAAGRKALDAIMIDASKTE